MNRFFTRTSLIFASLAVMASALNVPTAKAALPACDYSKGVTFSDAMTLDYLQDMYNSPSDYVGKRNCDPTLGVILPAGWTMDDLVATYGSNRMARLIVVPRATPTPSATPKITASPKPSATPKPTFSPKPVKSSVPSPSSSTIPQAKVAGWSNTAILGWVLGIVIFMPIIAAVTIWLANGRPKL